MPLHDFELFAVGGLNVNVEVDINDPSEGYVCFMRKKVPQTRFFDCYYKHVAVPFVNTVRTRYNPQSPKSDASNNINLDVILWDDSDISYLRQLTDPGRMKDSLYHGVYHAKIGVQITETIQPLNLRPNFKILKTFARTCTTKYRDKPLTIYVKVNF